MAAANVRELIDEHYAALYRYAFRLSGSAADADDLTQETFGKAMTRLEQLRDSDRARNWLYRILRNEYLHRVRDQQRSRVIPSENLGELPAREAETDPEFDTATLQAALNDLDESFRTPLILFYFDDRSYKDIAEQMELPIGTVMSRLARGKAYLRDRLTASTNGQARPRT